jgi:hypothetical protein
MPHRRFAVLALVFSVAVLTANVRDTRAQAVPVTVRFHHLHYRVGDPAAAMADVVRKLEGVRVILQGFGVGVRAGREFLLFDRAAANDPIRSHAAPAAYERATARLEAWGLRAEPANASHSRVLTGMPQTPVDHLAFVADDLPAVVQRVVRAGGTVVRRREGSVLFDAGNDLAIEILRDIDREETFWCPMHPDVRSADPGKCPVCSMTLVPIPPPKIGEYELDVTQRRDSSGRTRGLELAVREPDTETLVRDFALVHEKAFHLFVVGRDLRYFAHVHPDVAADGRLHLDQRLEAGEYMLIADFLPAGGTSQMVQKAIIVTGPEGDAPSSVDPRGLSVRMDADDLAVGKHAMLTFAVTDAATGAPVTDLEPYLGAPAHMLIVRRDLSDAIHAHPQEQVTAGPTVSFHPIIPAAGDYKLWIQFQRAGEVSTSAFEFTVKR